MKKSLKEKFMRKIDYRHYICVGITISFFLIAFLCFPYAFGRLIESFKDIGSSIKYFFNDLFGSGGDLTKVTVNDFSEMPFELPFNLPSTWEQFKNAWALYWSLFATKENLAGYGNFLGNKLFMLSRLLIIFMLFALVVFLFTLIYPKTENNDYNKDTCFLKLWRRFENKIYLPVKAWLLDFVRFNIEHGVYWKIWLITWAYGLNFITIFSEFIAFYLYFCASFRFWEIYIQIVKLFLDLSVLINIMPTLGWFVIGFVVLNVVRRKIGYARLNHLEMRNRGFINERPIVLMVCGTMGKKKTTMITDMALSQEIMFRDKAFEKILECDLKFPFFPWINLENDIKSAMKNHSLYNLATCRRFVASKRHKFFLHPKPQNLWGYNFDRYGTEYDDNLTVTDLWKVIEDYTQLYFIYIIESSLMISNYSIRTDAVLTSLGNFPLWNADLFKRDSRMQEAYSRYAHILDFDALRLGRHIVENNKNANVFEFGVINITEIGKERGNNLELQEKKKQADETNQKNDLFNSWLKMVRHSATVDNFPFVRVIVDEQRPESWGADARDLCEIVHTNDCSEMRLAMPFFALGDLLIGWFLGRFERKYYDYRYNRGDNTLFMYLYHGLAAKLNKYRTGIYNTFGFMKMDVLIESGTQDGDKKGKNYYLMSKKIYSRRFSTDAFSDYFNQKALDSPIGINDIAEFKTEKATFAEMLSENSYFFNDLDRIRNRNSKGENKDE